MAVNKNSKNCKTNRPELDDLQNRNSSFKMTYYFKNVANVILIEILPPKIQP